MRPPAPTMAIRLINTPVNHSQTGRHDTRFNPINKNRAAPAFTGTTYFRHSTLQKKMPGQALAFSLLSNLSLELHIVEEVLHPFKPGMLLRILMVTLLFLLKLLQQLFLPLGQVHWRLQHHSAHQVSRIATAYRSDPLATQPEQFAGLSFCRNLELDPPIQRGHLQLATQSRIRKADRHLAVQVLTVAHKNPVFAHGYLHIKISRRPAINTRLPLTCQTNAIASIHTRRHLHRQGFLLFYIPYAMTGFTGCANGFARAPTTGTGLLHRKEALLHSDLAGTMTGATGFSMSTRLCARGMTGATLYMRGHSNLNGGPPYRLFQV